MTGRNLPSETTFLVREIDRGSRTDPAIQALDMQHDPPEAETGGDALLKRTGRPGGIP